MRKLQTIALAVIVIQTSLTIWIVTAAAWFVTTKGVLFLHEAYALLTIVLCGIAVFFSFVPPQWRKDRWQPALITTLAIAIMLWAGCLWRQTRSNPKHRLPALGEQISNFLAAEPGHALNVGAVCAGLALVVMVGGFCLYWWWLRRPARNAGWLFARWGILVALHLVPFTTLYCGGYETLRRVGSSVNFYFVRDQLKRTYDDIDSSGRTVFIGPCGSPLNRIAYVRRRAVFHSFRAATSIATSMDGFDGPSYHGIAVHYAAQTPGQVSTSPEDSLVVHGKPFRLAGSWYEIRSPLLRPGKSTFGAFVTVELGPAELDKVGIVRPWWLMRVEKY